MKSLFQNIRAGIITKPAVELQLSKFKADKLVLTRAFLAKKLGHDLYTKKLAEMNFCIETMQFIIDKWGDLALPLRQVSVENETKVENLALPLRIKTDKGETNEQDDVATES